MQNLSYLPSLLVIAQCHFSLSSSQQSFEASESKLLRAAQKRAANDASKAEELLARCSAEVARYQDALAHLLQHVRARARPSSDARAWRRLARAQYSSEYARDFTVSSLPLMHAQMPYGITQEQQWVKREARLRRQVSKACAAEEARMQARCQLERKLGMSLLCSPSPSFSHPVERQRAHTPSQARVFVLTLLTRVNTHAHRVTGGGGHGAAAVVRQRGGSELHNLQ
jgi:hypothetical protein